MHTRLHAIHRPEIKGRFRGLCCWEPFGYCAGTLCCLLKLFQQHGALWRIADDQTPLPIDCSTAKVACWMCWSQVNEPLGGAQGLVKLHIVDQVKGVLGWLQERRMRYYSTL
jgi:hypothetical protein